MNYQQNLETINLILEIYLGILAAEFTQEEQNSLAVKQFIKDLSCSAGNYNGLKERLFAIINNIRGIYAIVEKINSSSNEKLNPHRIHAVMNNAWHTLLKRYEVREDLAANNNSIELLLREDIRDTLGLLKYSMNYNGILLEFASDAVEINNTVDKWKKNDSLLAPTLQEVSAEAINERQNYIRMFNHSILSGTSVSINTPADIYYRAIKNIIHRIPPADFTEADNIIRNQTYNFIIKLYKCITDETHSCKDEDPVLDQEKATELREIINKFYVDELVIRLTKIRTNYEKNTRNTFERYSKQKQKKNKQIDNGQIHEDYTYQELLVEIGKNIEIHNFAKLVTLMHQYASIYPEINTLREHVLNSINFWANNYHSLPDNKAADEVFQARMNEINLEAVCELKNYHAKRKDSFFLWLYDAWKNAMPNNANGKGRRLSAAENIICKLEQAKTPSEYINLFADLSNKIYGPENDGGIPDKSSRLRASLIEIQDRLAKALIKMNISDKVTSASIEAINNHFNYQIKEKLDLYKEKRGTESWFYSIFNNGLIKTIKEFAMSNRSVKDERVRLATYFSQLIQNCKSAQDYTSFILDSAHIISKLTDDSSGLRKKLIASQEEVVNRFLIHKKLLNFSLEEQILICLALERNDKQNSLAVKIKQNLTNEPNFARIYYAQTKNLSKTFSNVANKIDAYQKAINKQSDENNIKLYEDYLRDLLYQHFLADKVISSGEVSGNVGQKGQIANALNSLAGIVSPQVVSAPIRAGAMVLQKVDDAEMTEQRANVAKNFNTFSNLELLIEGIVKRASFEYCYQICELHPTSVMSFAGDSAARIIDFVKSGKLNPKLDDQTKIDFCVNALSAHEINHGILPGLKKSLLRKNGRDSWSVDEIFSTGIIDITDKVNPLYFVRRDQPVPPVCGYKVGTKKQASARDMQQVQVPVKHEHPALFMNFDKEIQSLNEMREVENLRNENKALKNDLTDLNRLVLTLTDVVEELSEPQSEHSTTAQAARVERISKIKSSLRHRLLPPPAENDSSVLLRPMVSTPADGSLPVAPSVNAPNLN